MSETYRHYPVVLSAGHNYRVLNDGEHADCIDFCGLVASHIPHHARIVIPSSALSTKIANCNQIAPKLAVEFHTNTGGGTGPEIWAHHDDAVATAAAKRIIWHMEEVWGASRGVRPQSASERTWAGRLGWLSKIHHPSILIELAFRDRASDMDRLYDVWESLAVAVAAGIVQAAA